MILAQQGRIVPLVALSNRVLNDLLDEALSLMGDSSRVIEPAARKYSSHSAQVLLF